MYSILTVLIAAAFVTLGVLLYKKNPAKFDIFLKVAVVTFCVIGNLRYPLADGIMLVLDGADVPQSLLRWGYHIGYAVLPMAVFFERRLFRNIATCFSLPMSLLAVICYNSTFSYFMTQNDGTWLIDASWRHVIYIAELTLAVAIPTLLLVAKGHRMNVKSRSEWLNMLAAIPAALFMMMPAWLIQSLFGYGNSIVEPKSFGLMHFSWIAYMIIACIVISRIFMHKEESVKHELCIFIAIAQVFHTMSIFLKGFTFHRVPLQLCCIAAFFYLYTMITRNKNFFNFCFISNMVGAFIAVVLMDVNSNALSFWNIHYMQEHSFVIILPIVALSIGLFPRINRTALKPITLIFVCYFVFCLVSGTILNVLSTNPDPTFYEVNYFYMFDFECALDYVPFAGFTGLIAIPIGRTTLYPLLIVFIFFVFLAICYLFYFMMQGIYALKDRITSAHLENTKPERIPVHK